MTTLLTARLLLRKPRPADAEALHLAMREPAAMRYWAHPEHETLDRTHAYVAKMIASEATGGDEFVIEHQGMVIGKAGMWRPHEIGFLLHPDHWGVGLAREALTALIAHLFSTHDTDHLTAEVDPRNAASLGLLTRMGFVETHRAEKTLQWRDEWCDSVYLRLDKAPVESAA